MRSCALDEPISCFLAKLHFADVVQLLLWDLLTPLTARHFEGLRVTFNLQIYDRDSTSVQKSIPYETIASLQHLTNIGIEGAQLTLASGPLQAPLLQKLDLTSDSISDVPRGFFKDLPSLGELLLRNNSIVDINNDTFTGLNKVTWLNLDQNRISELRGGALSPLRGLKGLSIEDNPLTRLHDGFLQGLDQLKQIKISSSEPLVLDPRAFADLRSLSNVMLEECRLQELPSTIFQGSKAIQMLNLRNNQLKRLHPEVFSNQTEMTGLDLSKNQLTNIDGHLFLTLIKLVELDLSYNQLEFLPYEMFWALVNLKSVSVSHNKLRQISTIETPRLIPLEFLDLSYNLIEDNSNDVIKAMTYLRLVNLTHNRVTSLPLPTYFHIRHISIPTVDLSYNNISTIVVNPEFFHLQKIPVKFILDHNPFNCDCHIYSFAKLATSYNYSQYFSLWNAECNAPVRVQGTHLTRVPLDEFVCTVKCSSVCNCTDVPNKDIVEAVCSEDSTELSRITGNVSLKFIRKPKTLRHRSFENVVKIDLSGLQLDEIDFEALPETVKVLNLSNNNLNYLPSEVLNKNISFALGNNPLSCDCWNKEYVAKLQQNSAKFLDYLALKCKYVKVYISKYFPYLMPEEKYDASKKFDVFISYAHQDEDFVRDMLLPKLEGPPINVKTCIHSRDWIVGEMIPYNIAKSVEESRRTVIVLSENFLKSIWGLLEFRTAHVQATKEGRTRVVVILLEDVMNKEDLNKEIKAYLRTNTYIKWGEPWFWEKLAYALPKRGKIVDSREEKRLQSIANELTETRLDMQLNNED
ncbi:hypothetical protein K1T71_014959 [Dendrolimus kikuchii]|nr:hypothetical protein K1T71_014959 [Dendrolimus kikuchii]